MSQYSKEMIAGLLAGTLSSDEIQGLQRQDKDPDRFEKILEVEQERLGWEEPILICLQESLYVVETQDGKRIVRCECGHEFGNYRENWKESAVVYERNPKDGRVYVGPRAADPAWNMLREFYCPGCATQLDVEVVPLGYPFIHNFVPDLEESE